MFLSGGRDRTEILGCAFSCPHSGLWWPYWMAEATTHRHGGFTSNVTLTVDDVAMRYSLADLRAVDVLDSVTMLTEFVFRDMPFP